MKTAELERFWSKVSVQGADECWPWTAYQTKYGYGQLTLNQKRYLAHRLSYELSVGPIPPNMHIDHICHTPACVNPGHLRVVTCKQNQENRTGAQRDSKSGVRGVWWRPDREKWQAQVEHNGHVYTVGSFVNLEDAAAAVRAKRLELFTHNDADRMGER